MATKVRTIDMLLIYNRATLYDYYAIIFEDSVDNPDKYPALIDIQGILIKTSKTLTQPNERKSYGPSSE